MTIQEKIKYDDGIYDISNEEYHKSQGYSRSQLFHLNKSDYHFWYNVLSGKNVEKEKTPSMIFGSLFHTLMLEPHKFEHEYIISPKIDKRTIKGKQEWEEFQLASENKTIITEEQYNKAIEMIDESKKHEIVANLLHNAKFEKSIFWTDKDTGIQFKVRPDIWLGSMVVDLKTCSLDNVKYYNNHALQNGYYLQAAMIFEAFSTLNIPMQVFINLVFEKEAPYVPISYLLSDECINYGKEQFNIFKNRLHECLQTNIWNAYPIQELTLKNTQG